MKILICDDDVRKADIIKDCVLEVYPKAEIKIVSYAKATILALREEDFGYLIQDMFLPINSNDRVDNKGGLYVLNQIELREFSIKYCICSSDSVSYRYMKESNFENVPFIDFSSSYFREDLRDFLGE